MSDSDLPRVLCSGCFNIMHAGHVEMFEFASKFGKVTVGLNADSYLYEKYGRDKTVPLLNRAKVVASCKYVDEVVVFLEDEPSALILQIRPDFYVRGPDYAGVGLIEQDAIDQVGAQLVIHQANKIGSSSELVNVAPDATFSKPKKKSLSRLWKNF